jgi:predicted nucleic acid-binding protein
MLVIADSSPLIVLANIGALHVLPSLFREVTIPPQVAAELALPNRPQVVREFISSPPAWLNIRGPSLGERIPHLQEGEIAAINLARELHADLLLIDDIQGRRAAAERKIPLTGTIGVLELAAKSNLLDLDDAFDRVKRTDFWISPKLLDERLKIYQKRKAEEGI